MPKIRIADLDMESARTREPDPEYVDRYRDLMQAGVSFPAIVVYEIGAEHPVLADGFQRCAATVHETIEADVREGTLDDARLFACAANSTHGKVAKPAEVVPVACRWWGDLSSRALADKLGIDDKTVAKYRPAGADFSAPETRTGKDGRQHPAKKPRKPKPPAEPESTDWRPDKQQSAVPATMRAAGGGKPARSNDGAGAAPAEGEAAPAQGSIEAAQAGVREWIAALDAARAVGRRVFGAKKQEFTAPWLGRFGFIGTIDTLNQMKRDAQRNMPVAGTAKKPVTAHDLEKQEAVNK